MMKRYTLKLSVGFVSLIAMGAGGIGDALAQVSVATSGTTSMTQTDLAFQMAMAQYQYQTLTQTVAQNEIAAPAAASLTVTTAAAAAATPVTAAAATNTPGPDGLVPGGAYIEADNIQSDSDDIVIAFGSVEMRYKGKTIRADQVVYNPNTGVTTATGHTQTINEDGSVQFADSITYDEAMSSGVSQNFASMMPDNTKVLARKVERVNETTNRLTDIIYTPCQLCVSHGVTQPPSWSIEAGKITQRKDKKMVYYDNATVKIHGVPVLYSPFLWTPDPEMPRASGLLQPKIGFTRKRGFSFEQPYLWSISDYSQLIISPQFNAKVNPLLNLEYKKKFYSGDLTVRFGFTNESFFDNAGNRIGDSETRDYVLADGKFKINDNWRWSFTAQHVKDANNSINPATHKPYGDNANFFERYNIDNPFQQVGELTVDSRELINQANITRQTDTSYLSMSMASFQSLQIAGGEPVTAETNRPYVIDNSIYPTVGPLIEGYWSPQSHIAGGQFTASVNAIGLQHKNFPGAAVAPGVADGTSGFDTARVSAGASWYADWTSRSGFKGGPFIDVRHDYYHETDLTSGGLKTNTNRDLGTAGVNLSYPLFRKFNKMTVIVEPIAQFAVSPKYQYNPNLPTEDSQSIEYDETTLFAVNKSPGFDTYESGGRLNLGLRTQFQFASNLKINALIGRTFRDRVETQYLKAAIDPKNGVTALDPVTHQVVTYDPSGVAAKSSDWIVDGDFDTGKGFYGFSRYRLGNTGQVKQGETGFSMYSTNTLGTVRYIVNNTFPVVDPSTKVLTSVYGPNYKDIQVYARHFITKNWGVSARLDRDLLTNNWRRSTVSLIYRDDCSWFEFIYQRNDTVLSTVNNKPQSSFMFRLNLATLSSSLGEFTDVR